jgi:hypothetical protein
MTVQPFCNIPEPKQKMIDEIINHQIESHAKKEKLTSSLGIKHLHMYFPDRVTLRSEIRSNISLGRALVGCSIPFEVNSKVILHIHVRNDFHTFVMNATVVMCSPSEGDKYQLGLEIEQHYETIEFLKEYSEVDSQEIDRK